LFFDTSIGEVKTGKYYINYTDRDFDSRIYLSAPLNYDSTKAYSLIIGWHGTDDSGAVIRDFLYNVLARYYDIILVCPDANYLKNKDSSYLENLKRYAYQYAMKSFNIAPGRIIASGFSWGGGNSFLSALKEPELYTGVIGLSPAISRAELTKDMWQNSAKLRLATIDGDMDFNHDAVNSLMADFENMNAETLFIIKPGIGHDDSAYFNSQEIKDDFLKCYKFVIGSTDEVKNSLGEAPEISLNPVPANDFINVGINSPSPSEIEIRLIDMGGNNLYQFKTKAKQSRILKTIELNDYPSGVYFLEVNIGNEVYSRKFTKIE
jgi:hypothetical protein